MLAPVTIRHTPRTRESNLAPRAPQSTPSPRRERDGVRGIGPLLDVLDRDPLTRSSPAELGCSRVRPIMIAKSETSDLGWRGPTPDRVRGRLSPQREEVKPRSALICDPTRGRVSERADTHVPAIPR